MIIQTPYDYLVQFTKWICFLYGSFLPMILWWAPCCLLLARALGYKKKQCLFSLASPLLLPFGLVAAVIPGLISEPLGFAVLLLFHFLLCRFSMKHPEPRRMLLYFLLSGAAPLAVIYLF